MQVYAEPLVNKNIKSESVGVGGWDWWSAEARFPSSSSSPTSLCPGCLLSPLRRNWHASPKLRGSVSSLLPKPSNLITGNRALFEEEKKMGLEGGVPQTRPPLEAKLCQRGPPGIDFHQPHPAGRGATHSTNSSPVEGLNVAWDPGAVAMPSSGGRKRRMLWSPPEPLSHPGLPGASEPPTGAAWEPGSPQGSRSSMTIITFHLDLS